MAISTNRRPTSRSVAAPGFVEALESRRLLSASAVGRHTLAMSTQNHHASTALQTPLVPVQAAATSTAPNLLQSESALNLSPWFTQGASVSADVTLAPDATQTADKLVE